MNKQTPIDGFGAQHSKQFLPTGKYSTEEYRLQDWVHPGHVMFRETEIAEMKSFIQKGIKESGSHVSLYITGMPGQGKTACLREVFQDIQNSHPEVGFYYQNALKLAKPHVIFARFWKQLTDELVNHQKAKSFLDAYFQEKKYSALPDLMRKRLEAVKVLIIDEVDFLLSKNNDTLYSVFDWTHAPYSKLLIVCVANTLDFPDKIQPKIKSRMGQKHINFAPYTAEQIEKIIQIRLGTSTLFTKEAIVYIARKCASISSDIRKSLHYCRRAIQYKRNHEPSTKAIDSALINKLFEEESKKPFAIFLKNESKIFRSLMVVIVNQFRLVSKNFFYLDAVFNAQNSLLSLVNVEHMAYSEFKSLIFSLQDTGILKVITKPSSRTGLSMANVIDAIKFALRNDAIFAKYLQT